jgi:hypothetical protein
MTRSEWLRIAARLMKLWPHQTIPDDALAEWYQLLADIPADAVNAAVTALATSGREFPPPAGVIRAKATELARPSVTFEQAWSEIHRCISAIGIYREEAALDALRSVPLAAELVTAMGGWKQVCLGGPDEYRATDPGVWRSQAEHAFKALAAQRRDDFAVAGLPGPHADMARQRLAAGWQRLADIPAVYVPPAEALGPGPDLRPALPGPGALPPRSNGVELKPEYRAELARLIRDGEEAKIPERWRPYVDAVRAEVSDVP